VYGREGLPGAGRGGFLSGPLLKGGTEVVLRRMMLFLQRGVEASCSQTDERPMIQPE
jgi:hypothetical protein